MTIEVTLFQALADVKVLGLPAGASRSGKKFEDFMVQQLYQALKEQGTPGVFPPRYTLRAPTCSGVAHQFDIVVRRNGLAAIECKFRRKVHIGDLFAFVGKLVDYRERPRSLFATTAKSIDDDILCYAIAHRIAVICSCLPPAEYMIHRVKPNTDLAHRLASLQTRLQDGNVARHLLIEWQNAYKRFTVEGYH